MSAALAVCGHIERARRELWSASSVTGDVQAIGELRDVYEAGCAERLADASGHVAIGVPLALHELANRDRQSGRVRRHGGVEVSDELAIRALPRFRDECIVAR